MRPREPVGVFGLGAVTAIGATRAVVAAATRARIPRVQRSPAPALAAGDRPPSDGEESPSVHLARLETLTEDLAADVRIAILAEQAACEALRPLRSSREPVVLSAWLVVPDDLPGADQAVSAAVARACEELAPSLRVGQAVTRAGGQAAGLEALALAVAALESGAAAFALVLGADLRSAPEIVEALLRAGRVHGDGNPWGFAPGEGAAAVLLGLERPGTRNGLAAVARVAAWGVAREPMDRPSAPNVGDALTRAVRHACEALPVETQIAEVLCDLNGERARTDEWGFCLPRLAPRLADPSAFLSAAPACGDLGAATSPLLLMLAAARGSSAEPSDRFALAWAASDDGARGAVLVEAVAPCPIGLCEEPPAPELAALNDGMLREMAAECEFRFAQWGRASREQHESALSDVAAAASAEEILDLLVGALGASGAAGARAGAAAAEAGTPGAIYAAARATLEGTAPGAALDLAARVPLDDAEIFAALAAAFVHADARLDGEIVERLAHQGGATARLAAAIGGRGAWHPTVRAASAWLREGPSAEAARALGRLGDPAAAPLLAAWQRAADASVRTEVALAQLRLHGMAAAREIARLLPDAAVLCPVALAADQAIAAYLVAGHATLAAAPDYAWALGLAGEAGALPWLLSALDGPAAGGAAEALELMTGASPHEEAEIEVRRPDEELSDDELAARRAGDSAVGVERETATRLSRDRGVWTSLTARFVSRPGERWRAGEPASAAANLTLLRRAHIRPQLRRLLAEELAIRWRAPIAFDPTMMIRQQRAAFAELERRLAMKGPPR